MSTLHMAMLAGGAIGLGLGFAAGVYVGYTASWAHFVRKYVSLENSNAN